MQSEKDIQKHFFPKTCLVIQFCTVKLEDWCSKILNKVSVFKMDSPLDGHKPCFLVAEKQI